MAPGNNKKSLVFESTMVKQPNLRELVFVCSPHNPQRKCVFLTARKTCCYFSMELAGVTYHMNHMVRWMLDVFFHYFLDVDMIFCFESCGHWLNCIHFVELEEPSPKWYTGNDPPPVFTHLLPHGKNRKKCFLGGEFFAWFFGHKRSAQRWKLNFCHMQIPGVARETPGQSMPGTPTARGGQAICGVIDGFFPCGRGWSSLQQKGFRYPT